jgi:hypothetical protein
MKPLIALLACLLLPACSLWPWGGDDRPAPAAAPKSIGVISAISEQASLTELGNLGWEKASVSLPIDDWHLDDQVTARAAQALQRAGYDVRPLHYATRDFQATAIGGPVLRGGMFDRKRPDLTPIIRRAVQPNDLDYYLVLVEAAADSGAYRLRGVGLLRQRSAPTAFVLYHVFLIDGHSGEVIADTHADPLGNGGYELQKIDGPFTALSADAWPRPIADWTPAQRQKLRDAVDSLLDQSLPLAIGQVAPKP